MVRKYKNKNDEICIDVDCLDKCSMLRFVQFDSDWPSLYSVTLWGYAGDKTSFYNRLKAAWRVLWTGYGYPDIVLTQDCLKELKEIL